VSFELITSNILDMKNRFILSIAFFAMVSIASAQEWQTDFDQAQAIATKDNLSIILVFQGSDWCAPCMKLEKEIWSTKEFIELAKGNFVMVKADFPRRKKNALSPEQQESNNKLAAKYNTNGYFPFVVVLDKEGKVLGETGYKKMSPTDYFSSLMTFIK